MEGPNATHVSKAIPIDHKTWKHQRQLLICYNQCDQKKLPNVYKSCLKMFSLEKNLTPLKILPKNVGDLGKLIIAKGFIKLPKIQ